MAAQRKRRNWIQEERRKTLGDWVAFCLACGHTQRYFLEHEAELPPACPTCGGEMRNRCPACGAPIPSAFAVAWSRAAGATWPLILGAFAVGGTILCAAFIYLYAMRPRAGGGPILTTVSPSRRSRLTQILDELARRDFIYLVMVLALFGKAYWFLAPTAVGTPLFFLALLAMAFGGRRATAAAQ